MTDQPPKPADHRARRIYVLWGAGFSFLLALGLFCWLVVAPCIEVRAVLKQCVEQNLSVETAVRQLGGPHKALPKLQMYTWMGPAFIPYRSNVPNLLSRCGPPAISTLKHMLYNDTKDVSCAAGYALADIGEPAIPVLSTALRAEIDDVRAIAAYALGEMELRGLDNRAIEGLLLEATKDPEPIVRSAATEALKKIRGEELPK